jgi:hypothetical protein
MDFEDASEELPNNPGEYEGLEGRSSGIIDFDAMPGFGFRWGSQISSRFERSIRLMILPPFPTVGFSYSSRPAPSMHQAMEEAMARELEAQRDEEDPGEGSPAESDAADEAAETKPLLRPLDTAVLGKAGSEVVEHSASEGDADGDDGEGEALEQKEEGDGHFMLSAEATFDGMVQGMYMQRFNKHWSTRHMVLTSMEPGRSMLMSSLSFNGGSFTSKLSWNSERDRVSFSHMQAITKRLSAGGEVGYATKDADKPLGWSMGARYVIRHEGGGKFAATHITASYNHVGRVKMTYTLPFSETVFASARYTVNAFSCKSNMAVGVESWPSAAMPLMTKAKWDTDKGFGVSLGAHLGLAAIMFSASYGKNGPMVGLHFEL